MEGEPVEQGPRVQVTSHVPAEMAARIDELAEADNRTRSRMVEVLLSRALELESVE